MSSLQNTRSEHNRIVAMRSLLSVVIVGALAMAALMAPSKASAAACRPVSSLNFTPDIFSSIETGNYFDGRFATTFVLNSAHLWRPEEQLDECPESADGLEFIPGDSHNVCEGAEVGFATNPFGGVFGGVIYDVCLEDLNDVVITVRGKFEENWSSDQVVRPRRKVGSVSIPVQIGQNGVPQLQFAKSTFRLVEAD